LTPRPSEGSLRSQRGAHHLVWASPAAFVNSASARWRHRRRSHRACCAGDRAGVEHMEHVNGDTGASDAIATPHQCLLPIAAPPVFDTGAPVRGCRWPWPPGVKSSYINHMGRNNCVQGSTRGHRCCCTAGGAGRVRCVLARANDPAYHLLARTNDRPPKHESAGSVPGTRPANRMRGAPHCIATPQRVGGSLLASTPGSFLASVEGYSDKDALKAAESVIRTQAGCLLRPSTATRVLGARVILESL
jgi:hypothetical protein